MACATPSNENAPGIAPRGVVTRSDNSDSDHGVSTRTMVGLGIPEAPL